MSSTSSPPRAPAWLVELFASPQEADGILGDLAEEFSATLVCDGDQEARRRYKRQAWRTIKDLAVSPLRARSSSSATMTASGLMLTAATGLAGLVMSWPVAAMTNIVAGTIVRRYPIADYIPIAVFWDGVNLLGLLMTGVVVATVARHLKFRPMSAALAMIAMMAILFAVDRPIAMWLYGPSLGQPFTLASSLVRWARGVLMFGGVVFIGAAIARMAPWPDNSVSRRMSAQ